MEAINNRASELLEGTLSEEECNQLLLLIFPEKVRRTNTGTLTFLKTYFSDGEGERASFYPRIYDSFLRFIAEGGPPGSSSSRPRVEKDRVAQDLIFDAHVYACKDYLKQVKDEMKYLINLASSPQENQRLLNEMLESFNGMTTPFALEMCVTELQMRMRDEVSDTLLRKAMQQMKKIGIFEDRPDYPGHWRVGRLFKASLEMRYNRRRRDDA